MIRSLFAALALIWASVPASHADIPAVATDIPPVHALAAQVMAGLGTPSLMVPPGTSPHDFSMRPSQAAALARADLVLWVGAGLTPWLPHAIQSLAGDAVAVELLEAEGTMTLPFRQGVTFENHDDDLTGSGHDDHQDIDPHAWLDPENGKAWLDRIAIELAALDPENAALYAANAAAGKVEIDRAVAGIESDLAASLGTPFVVFHDAYQYFENRFGMNAAGAISLGSAAAPSPARIAEIRAAMQDLGVVCVFSEPQFNPGLVAAVLEGTGAKTAILDPLGAERAPGAALYTDLLRQMARDIAACR